MNCQENELNSTLEQCLGKNFYLQLLSMISNIWLLKIRLFCSLPLTQLSDYICFPLSSRAELSMQKDMKKESYGYKVLHAQSNNSPLSYEHPRTACIFLNHRCTYAVQIKAIRNLAAFTFIGLPLPEICCFLTCITTQKQQPEMPSFV